MRKTNLFVVVAIILGVMGGWPVVAEEISVFATGTASKKDDVVSIKITGAREQNGVSLIRMKDKSLKVVGKNVWAVEKLIEKDIEIRGTIKDDTEIDVTWIKEKKEQDSAVERKNRRESQAIGAVGQPVGAINGSGEDAVSAACGTRGALTAINSRERMERRRGLGPVRRPLRPNIRTSTRRR